MPGNRPREVPPLGLWRIFSPLVQAGGALLEITLNG
jgi:hypothetical protein